MDIVKNQIAKDKLFAAICAGPLVLLDLDFDDKVKINKITSWPSFESKFTNAGISWSDDEDVIKDGEIITLQGPGTSFSFALEVVYHLTRDDDLIANLKK